MLCLLVTLLNFQVNFGFCSFWEEFSLSFLCISMEEFLDIGFDFFGDWMEKLLDLFLVFLDPRKVMDWFFFLLVDLFSLGIRFFVVAGVFSEYGFCQKLLLTFPMLAFKCDLKCECLIPDLASSKDPSNLIGSIIAGTLFLPNLVTSDFLKLNFLFPASFFNSLFAMAVSAFLSFGVEVNILDEEA